MDDTKLPGGVLDPGPTREARAAAARKAIVYTPRGHDPSAKAKMEAPTLTAKEPDPLRMARPFPTLLATGETPDRAGDGG